MDKKAQWVLGRLKINKISDLSKSYRWNKEGRYREKSIDVGCFKALYPLPTTTVWPDNEGATNRNQMK